MGELQSDMNQNDINKVQLVIYFILTFITILLIGVWGVKKSIEITEVLKVACLFVMMTSMLLFYIKTRPDIFHFNQKEKVILSIGYLASLVGTVISLEYEIYNGWMLGVVILSVLIKSHFVYVLQFILSYLIFAMNHDSIEYFIYYFILGTILCILGPYMQKKTMLKYVLIISVSSNMALYFILYGFCFSNLDLLSLLFSSLIIVGMVLIAYGVAFVHDYSKKKVTKDFPIYEILQEDFELLGKLQSHSQKLFSHSIEVGRLSFMAAKEIQCNENIAKAGGLYHEIGRVKGQNYIEEGVNLALSYEFPEKVVDIIRQHNSQYDKPKSLEAAVVMLTDSVVSTLEYIKYTKKENKIPVGKIIDGIFENRFSKGMLDESGMTISDYKLLLKFYKEINYDNSF